VASDEILQRFDAHLARGNELMKRIDARMERGDELIERIDLHMARNEAAFLQLQEEMKLNREEVKLNREEVKLNREMQKGWQEAVSEISSLVAAQTSRLEKLGRHIDALTSEVRAWRRDGGIEPAT
jgi:uncharacterized coiled-coil protein SlyX